MSTNKKKPGRKSKFTPKVREVLMEAVSKGATMSLACKSAGISIHTYTRWMRQGREGKKPYAQFVVDIEKAQGDRAQRWLEQIELAAYRGSWQAAAWLLERTEHESYGKRAPIVPVDQDDNDITVTIDIPRPDDPPPNGKAEPSPREGEGYAA